MAKRITIMIDEELNKKIRKIQAERIQTTSSFVSYSKVISEILQKNIKK